MVPMTRKQFEKELEQLHFQLLDMGTLVEEALYRAIRALIQKDVEAANEVITNDLKINQAEMEIENACRKLIALQQPVGSDLRRIIATLKVTTDLERMGDHAVSLADAVIQLKDEQYAKPLIDIPNMAQIVKKMVHDVLEAYVKVDTEAAKEIAKRDDEVDKYYYDIFAELVEMMKQDKDVIYQASHLLLVAQYLERIGDYATNICESIVYLSTGESVELN